ncbi:alpha-galactosidase [Trifolium repens]|nr:alpha-galactosidase [Trifolium repens]
MARSCTEKIIGSAPLDFTPQSQSFAQARIGSLFLFEECEAAAVNHNGTNHEMQHEEHDHYEMQNDDQDHHEMQNDNHDNHNMQNADQKLRNDEKCGMRNNLSKRISMMNNYTMRCSLRIKIILRIKFIRIHGFKWSLVQVRASPLSGNRLAVVLWNRSSAKATVTAFWSDLDLEPGTLVDVRDLWLHSTQSSVSGDISAELESHACKMYILTPN